MLTVDLELRRKDDLELLLNTASRIDSYELGTDNYNDEIEKLVRTNYLQFDVLKPLFDCSFSCQRQLLFDSQLYTQSTHLGQLKFKDAQISGKIEVVVLIFTDNLLVCKQINSGGRWHHRDKDHHQSSTHQSITSSHQSPSRQASNATTTYSNVTPQKYLNLSHTQHHQQQKQQQLRQRTNSEIQHHRLNAPTLNNGQPPVMQSESLMSARASSLIFTPGGGLESTQISESELNLLGQEFNSTRQRHSSSSGHFLAASLKNQPAMTVTAAATTTTTTTATPNQPDRYSSHHSSSSSLIGHAAREFFLRTASNSKSGDNLEPQQQKRQQQKQYQLGSYHHNLLNISSNSIFNLTNHGQASGSSQQQMAASSTHLRVIRSPYPIERLVMHELKDGQGVFCCQMNDSHTMANSFVLYSSIAPLPQAATSDLSKASDNSTNIANISSNHFKTPNSRSDSESFNSLSSSYGGSTRRRSSDSRWFRFNQASLSPARQLINMIKQAQIRYQLAANFHNVNLYTFDSPEKEELQQQQQQLKQAEQLVQKISNNSNKKQSQQHRSRLSTWSSFRHPTKRVNSDSATSNKQAKSKGLNSQGSLKQDAFEFSRLSPRSINSQRQTWLLDKRSASSENQITNFESNNYESGRRASVGITDQSASKRTDPFMRAIIEQHQLMLLNHGRHEELATCDFRYLVVNSNYLNVIPIAVSLTSPSPLFEQHNHEQNRQEHEQEQEQEQHQQQQPQEGYSGEDQAQIGDKVRHQIMQFSRIGSQSSVFEEPISVSGAENFSISNNTNIEKNYQNNQLIVSSQNNNFDQTASCSLDNNSGTFSMSSDRAQLLSPNRYNFTHSRYKKIINDRRGANSTAGSNLSQLSRLSRLASDNSNQSNSNLEFSSDNEATSEALKPNSSTDNSSKSNTTSFNSSSASSTRSSSPCVNDEDNNNSINIRKSSLQALLKRRQQQRQEQQQQFRSKRSPYSDSMNPPRNKQNNNQLQSVSISTSNMNSLALSELSSELEYENNVNTKNEKLDDHIEIRRAPRRHLNSLRRQNVIQSISAEQTQREQQQQQQQQQSHFYDSIDELEGNSRVKMRTKYLTKLSQRESSETTTSGPSVSNLTNSSILDIFNSKPVRQPIRAHNSSQLNTMDQLSVTFDNDEEILPGASFTTGSNETGAPSEIRATSFELGNLLRDRHLIAFDDSDKFDSNYGIQIAGSGVRSASIETSTTLKGAKSPISVTLTVPNNEQLQTNNFNNNKHCLREQFKNKRATTNQTTTLETKPKSPSFLKIPTKHRQTIGMFGGTAAAGGEWSPDDTSWSNQSGKLSTSPLEASSCCSNDFIQELQNDQTGAYLNTESYNEAVSSNNTELQSSSLSSATRSGGGLVLRKLRRILNLNLDNRAQAQRELDVLNDVDRYRAFRSTDSSSERAASKSARQISTSEAEGANQVPVLNVTTASPQNLDSNCSFLPVDDSLENLSSGSLVEPSFTNNQNQSVSDHFKKYGSLYSCQSSPTWHKHTVIRRSSSSNDLKPNVSANSNTISPNHSDTSIEGNNSNSNHNDNNNNNNDSEYKHFIKRCQILFQFNRRNNRHNMKQLDFSSSSRRDNKNKTSKIRESDLSKSQDSISLGKTSGEAGILDDSSLRPPETRKFMTNSDQNLSSSAIKYRVQKTIIRSNNDLPKLRAALSEAYADDSFSEYDNSGALIDMNCIGNLMNMRLNSESKPDSDTALFDDGILRQSGSQNIAYLGFHEKLKLHNKQMKDEKALREKKKQEKLPSATTESQDQQKQTLVDVVSHKTEPRYRRASKLRAHFVSKSRRDHHLNVASNNNVINSFRGTSKAFNLSRSMTGEIFDSLLRAASLRTVSSHNNTSSSQQG